MASRIQADTFFRVVLHYTELPACLELACSTEKLDACLMKQSIELSLVKTLKDQPNTSVMLSISHNLQFIALPLSAPLNDTVFQNLGLKYCNDWYCCQRTNICPSLMLSWCGCSWEKSGLCYVDWPYGWNQRKIHVSCEQQHCLNELPFLLYLQQHAPSCTQHTAITVMQLKQVVGPGFIENPSYCKNTVLV